MARLGVNIDHVATLRQARYRSAAGGPGAAPGALAEPDPVRAVHEAELGGADCITVHLREDRRHVLDADLELICRVARVKVNLEMAATEEMARIATAGRGRGREGADGERVGIPPPQMVTLVPEGRQEVTTEGGLDVAGQASRLREYVARLKGAGVVVSAFVDAEARQVEAAAAAGFDACEVHTGPYARAFGACGGEASDAALAGELERVADAGRRIRSAGLRFNAGHGLNYANAGVIAALPGVWELHIGHAIVSRAVFVGLRAAVREMKAVVSAAAGGGVGGGGG